MKKSKYILSLICNIIIVAALVFGVGNIVMNWLPSTKVVQNVLMGIPQLGNGGWLQAAKIFYMDAAALLALSALIFVISDIVCLAHKEKVTPRWISVLKLVATVTAILSTAVSIVAWRVKSGSIVWTNLLDWHHTLWIFVVAPVVALISYVFFELEPRVKANRCFYAIIPFAIYVGAATAYVCLKKVSYIDSIYWVLVSFHTNTWYLNVAWLGGGVVGATFLAFLLILLRNVFRKHCVKEEPTSVTPIEENAEEGEPAPEEKAPAPAPAPKATPAPATSAATSQPVAKAPANKVTTSAAPRKTGKKVIIIKSKADKEADRNIKIEEDTGDEATEEAAEIKAEAAAKAENPNYRGTARVYHISKQPSGKWQVKLATGERAIKLFDTQEQAIIYAKSLVRSQGGSIRIHGLTGKLRKE